MHTLNRGVVWGLVEVEPPGDVTTVYPVPHGDPAIGSVRLHAVVVDDSQAINSLGVHRPNDGDHIGHGDAGKLTLNGKIKGAGSDLLGRMRSGSATQQGSGLSPTGAH